MTKHFFAAVGLVAGACAAGCVGEVNVGSLPASGPEQPDRDASAASQLSMPHGQDASTSVPQGQDASTSVPQGQDASTAEAAASVTPLRPAPGESVVTLASGLISPYQLALDATSVYWADYSSGSVGKVALGGGAATTLVSGLSAPLGIAVDATGVYFTGVLPGSQGTCLAVVPTAGGTPQFLSSSFVDDEIMLGSSMVVGTGGPPGASDALYGFPTGGTATQSLAGPISNGSGNTYGLAIDSTNVYWSCFDDPCPILKTPLDGGTSTTLATGHVTFGVAVDATNVYWAEAASGTIMKVPINGGQATTVASGLKGPDQIAVDGDSLYVTTGFQSAPGAGSILKIAKDGSAVTVLVSGVSLPQDIAVDATSVYWSMLGDGATCGSACNGASSPKTGAIMKVTPK